MVLNQVKIKYELEGDVETIQPALGRGISRACVYRIGVYMRHEERYWVWYRRETRISWILDTAKPPVVSITKHDT